MEILEVRSKTKHFTKRMSICIDDLNLRLRMKLYGKFGQYEVLCPLHLCTIPVWLLKAYWQMFSCNKVVYCSISAIHICIQYLSSQHSTTWYAFHKAVSYWSKIRQQGSVLIRTVSKLQIPYGRLYIVEKIQLGSVGNLVVIFTKFSATSLLMQYISA